MTAPILSPFRNEIQPDALEEFTERARRHLERPIRHMLPGQLWERVAESAPAHVCPWVGDCLCARDAARCQCGHKNVSHGSFTRGAFTGTGSAACGLEPCECLTFTPEARA